MPNHLQQLIKDSRKTSKAALLQDHMPDIEAALAAGASRTQVLEALANDGLSMTMAYFDVARRRIKARLGVPVSAALPSSGLGPAVSTPSGRLDKPSDAAPPAQNEAALSDQNVENAASLPAKPNDPKSLKAIFAQKVDLDGYAKLASKGKK